MTTPVEEPEALEYAAPEPLDGAAVLVELGSREADALHPMGHVVQRAVGQVESTDAATDKATFTIVTRDKTRNRHGNMVQITAGPNGGGLLLDAYKANPVVLFEHGFSQIVLPVGLSETPDRSLTVKLAKGKATADVYFSKLPHGQLIAAAVHEGLVRMASIGFFPRKAMRLKPAKEGELPPGVEDVERLMLGHGLDFTEAELMEWSLTLVGADRGALRQCLDRGKIHDLRLTPAVRQSIESYAGGKAAWSPGWKPPIPESQQQSTAPETAPPAENPVDEAPTIATTAPQQPSRIRPQQLADAFLTRTTHPATSLQTVLDHVASRISTVIEQKAGETISRLNAVERELHRMTGRLD